MSMRVLIVDDEPLARSRLRRLVAARDDLELVGECADGREAIDAIRSEKPDLVFLDVQMPEVNGFEVIRALEPDAIPPVIFVTAYDQYALRAFEVHAIDYLLKPFDDERFDRAVAGARERRRQERAELLGERMAALLSEVTGEKSVPGDEESGYLDRIAIRSSGRVQFVRVDDLDWIEGSGVYVKLHTATKEYLLRDTLSSLDERLDPARFARIHRSTIVNVDRVSELRPGAHGEYVVVLHDDTELKLSRRYRSGLDALLGHKG
jgi:two-component system, LytTR family, response regulator